MKTFETIQMTSLADWHLWLQEHHQTSLGVWLMFYKVTSGQPCISYDDALDEALCFGWIDSIIKKVDDERYIRKFTPRTNLTNWSSVNIRRVRKLIQDGRMQSAGYAKIGDIDAFFKQTTRVRPPTPVLPPEIECAIQANVNAWEYWQTLTLSHRREYIWWLTSAKRPETVARRLAEALVMLEQKKLLGLR